MKRCSGRADYMIGIDNTPTRKPHMTAHIERSEPLEIAGPRRSIMNLLCQGALRVGWTGLGWATLLWAGSY